MNIRETISILVNRIVNIATITASCECGNLSNRIEYAGRRHKGAYMKFGCNKCKKWTYYSITKLKHKPTK